MGERIVSVSDAAIDWLEMAGDAVEYLRTRDENLLKFVPGKEPTWFYLRDISTTTFMKYVGTPKQDDEKFLRAFSMGVAKIENLVTRDGDAKRVVEPEGARGAHFTDEQIDAVFPDYVREIGMVAFERSRLGKARAAASPLPQWLGHLLVARLHQDAVNLSKTLTSESSEAPKELGQSTPEDGESATAATAPAKKTSTKKKATRARKRPSKASKS